METKKWVITMEGTWDAWKAYGERDIRAKVQRFLDESSLKNVKVTIREHPDPTP